jgi:hypothetical protein
MSLLCERPRWCQVHAALTGNKTSNNCSLHDGVRLSHPLWSLDEGILARESTLLHSYILRHFRTIDLHRLAIETFYVQPLVVVVVVLVLVLVVMVYSQFQPNQLYIVPVSCQRWLLYHLVYVLGDQHLWSIVG